MHVTKARKHVAQSEVPPHATQRMQAQSLIDLIDQSAPDDGVVDIHELEASFASGTRKIERPTFDDGGAVVEAVETSSESTRRMSAVEWDAAISAVESEVHSESTMRMCAIQANELVALITPVEVSVIDEPMVRVSFVATPNIPAVAAPVVAAPIVVAPMVEMPVRRRWNAWMVFACVAVAGAAAALIIVAQ